MANPNPKTRSDYRKIKDPLLRTRDILLWFVDSGLPLVSSGDVAEEFKIPVADASSRLRLLKKWGTITIEKRGRGPKPHEYAITAWGGKMYEKWNKENLKEE